MIVRCPQCGTTFDKDANEFCPKCGYASAFILTPAAESSEPDEMLRRPGEQATQEQPVVDPVVQPTVFDPTPPTRTFATPPPPPPKRRRSTGVYVGIGFAVGLVIAALIVILLTRGGGGSAQATTGATTGATSAATSPSTVVTPTCTTAFFQGSLGQRVLGLCPQAMRGNDVVTLQQQLNLVLQGQRVLVVDGSFGPKTATAVREYQQCRGIKPANSIVDAATAQRLIADTAEDSCATTLPDLGPPHAHTPSPNPSPSSSPSPSPTDTLPSPT